MGAGLGGVGEKTSTHIHHKLGLHLCVHACTEVNFEDGFLDWGHSSTCTGSPSPRDVQLHPVTLA